MGISIAILIVLFSIQRFGTRWVGYAFSPVILLWFLFNAIIGIYNIAKFDPRVFRAISPSHWFSYFLRNGRGGWKTLGGVVLCVTGGRLLLLSASSVRNIRVRGVWGQVGAALLLPVHCVHSYCMVLYCITGWGRCCHCCDCHQTTWCPFSTSVLLFPADSRDLPSPFCKILQHSLLAAGAEALYADMGHFSISAIRVCSSACLAHPVGRCDHADTHLLRLHDRAHRVAPCPESPTPMHAVCSSCRAPALGEACHGML